MSTPDPGGLDPSRRPRILLVEDNDAASKGLSRLLMAWGYDVTVVIDGTSALDTLRAGPPPDFLLTDLRLPDLDGREVARFASQLAPRPRVALITGWDIDSHLRDHGTWGIDWVIPKPVNVYDLISKLRGDGTGEGGSAQPRESAGGGPRTP